MVRTYTIPVRAKTDVEGLPKYVLAPGVFDEQDEILAGCSAWIDGGNPNDSRNWRYFAIAGFLAAIGHDRLRVLDVGCGIGWPTFILAPFCGEIVGLDYSLDGGGWEGVQSSDGLLDSSDEDFSFLLEELSAGEHSIVVRARDRAGNIGTGRVRVD